MIIGLSQLFLKILNLIFRLLQLNYILVHILHRSIRYQTRPCRIIKRTHILFQETINRREAGDHEGVRVSSEGLLQQLRQLTLPIRYKLLIIFLLG